jgi:hypothetical protein
LRNADAINDNKWWQNATTMTTKAGNKGRHGMLWQAGTQARMDEM